MKKVILLETIGFLLVITGLVMIIFWQKESPQLQTPQTRSQFA